MSDHVAAAPLSLNGAGPTVGLFAWLVEEARREGSREALIEVLEGKERVISIDDLLSRSRSFAAGLASIGVVEGSTVALWLPNQSEWMVAQFACAALGAAVLGLNTRYRSHELTHLLATVPVSVMVLPSAFLGIDFLGTLRVTLMECEHLDEGFLPPALVFVGAPPAEIEGVVAKEHQFDELCSRDDVFEWRDYPTATSNLFTTSGSTSKPKVASHNQSSIVRHSHAGARALGAHAGDRILAALPLCGVFGYNSAMAVLFGGGAVVLMRSFDPLEAARLLEMSRITHIVGGDEMLLAALEAVPEGTILPALRRGGIASFAGRAKDVVLMAQERWGASISGVYGSSELFALTAIWPATDDLTQRVLQGGVVVDPGIEVRVVDMESGELIPDGQSGELQFRGYNTITAYLNNPDATNEAFSVDGWFRTGDLGYRHGTGFVYQCRAREALRLRGFLVEPGEIEEYFSLDPAVEEVHVIGVESGEGMKAIAFVRARQGQVIDESSMLTRAKERLAGFKIPARIVEVAEFPTTTGTNGTKVRFEELRIIGRKVLAP